MTDKDLGSTLSPKVVAGTAGAGAGAIVTTAVTWALGAGAFGGGWDAASVEGAMAAVPAPLVALVALGIGVAFTFLPAWWIRDHVREEGAAAIAARPDGPPGEVDPYEEPEEVSLSATAHAVQEVLDRHLASRHTEPLVDHGTVEADVTEAREEETARGL